MSNNGPVSGTIVPSTQENFDFIKTLTDYKWHILVVFIVIVVLYMFYRHEQKKKENKHD